MDHALQCRRQTLSPWDLPASSSAPAAPTTVPSAAMSRPASHPVMARHITGLDDPAYNRATPGYGLDAIGPAMARATQGSMPGATRATAFQISEDVGVRAWTVGSSVTFTASHTDVPTGQVGEVLSILEDGRLRIRFSNIRMTVRPSHIVATPEA